MGSCPPRKRRQRGRVDAGSGTRGRPSWRQGLTRRRKDVNSGRAKDSFRMSTRDSQDQTAFAGDDPAAQGAVARPGRSSPDSPRTS